SVSAALLQSSSHCYSLLSPLATIRMLSRWMLVAFPLLIVGVAFAQDVEATTAPVETTPEGSGSAPTDAVSSTPAADSATTVAPVAATNGTKCEGFKLCSSAADCGSGTGNVCLGAFVGKCNCNACMNFWSCKDDAACGGLKGACDSKSNTCRCWEALEKQGFPFVKAATSLCNQKECNPSDSSVCLGLPCNMGRCVCKA
ncbi:hypothetical protein PMAYCL1PPCAC_30149, partial [Pristionchus mayeri]